MVSSQAPLSEKDIYVMWCVNVITLVAPILRHTGLISPEKVAFKHRASAAKYIRVEMCNFNNMAC